LVTDRTQLASAVLAASFVVEGVVGYRELLAGLMKGLSHGLMARVHHIGSQAGLLRGL
jgi:hypothetical protein